MGHLSGGALQREDHVTGSPGERSGLEIRIVLTEEVTVAARGDRTPPWVLLNESEAMAGSGRILKKRRFIEEGDRRSPKDHSDCRIAPEVSAPSLCPGRQPLVFILAPLFLVPWPKPSILGL